MIGRLRQETTLDRAGEHLTSTLAFRRASGDSAQSTLIVVERLGRAEGGSQQRLLKVTVALSAVAFLLLIATSANAANILLSGYLRRRKEIAVRAALGAGGRSLFLTVAVDGTLIGLVSTITGMVFAAVGSFALHRWVVPTFGWSEFVVTRKVLFVGGAMALVTTTIMCIAPWLQTRRLQVAAVLGSESGGSTASSARWRSFFLAFQAGTVVLLLTGAGLFANTLQRLRTTNLGFSPTRVIVVDAGFSSGSAVAAEIGRYLVEFRGNALLLPGISHAGLASGVPLRRSSATWVQLNGMEVIRPLETGGPYFVAIDEHTLEALQTRILRGRGFTAADMNRPWDAVIVNETMASTVWKGQDPLAGGCLVVAKETTCRQVVGVVEDMKRENILEPPTLQFFVPLSFKDPLLQPQVLYVRATSDPKRALSAVAELLSKTWPGNELPKLNVMSELLEPELAAWRTAATIFAAYGIIAFAVANLGILGVLSLALSQRRRELAIRVALGARWPQLVPLLGLTLLRDVCVGAAGGLLLLAGSWQFVLPLLHSIGTVTVITTATRSVTLVLLVASTFLILASIGVARKDAAHWLRVV
jgi:hypothetical protein